MYFMVRFIAISSSGRAGKVAARYRVRTSRFNGQQLHDELIPTRACAVIEGLVNSY
jgi:hypothetical protein